MSPTHSAAGGQPPVYGEAGQMGADPGHSAAVHQAPIDLYGEVEEMNVRPGPSGIDLQTR